MKLAHTMLALAMATTALSPVNTVLAQTQAESGLPIIRGEARLQDRGAYIDQLVADFIAAHQLPGLTMAIVQAPYIPRSAGYGKTSLDHDELASTRTLWNVGPITQAFTAVAVMQLKERGKLRLEDQIGSIIEDLPAAWRRVTLLQLMQHSSGIPDYRDQLDQNRRYAPRELIDLVAGKPLLFERGTEVRLSATDSTLLAMVVERVSGMSYHDFVWKNQIEPEGLTATMFANDIADKAAVDRPVPTPVHDNQHARFKSDARFINPVEPATGYRSVDGRMAAVAPETSANLFGFGDLWSSAEDISKWDIALAGSTLIRDPADRDVVYKPARLTNGTVVPAMAGWEFTHHPGFMEVKGSAPGFSAYLSRFTESAELVCVTLLTNKEGVDLTVLARDIAAAYKDDLGPLAADRDMVAQESKFGVTETVSRIKAGLTAANVPVFATVDHAANARGVGETLRATTVITFGSPKVGTRLMQEDQTIGLDLPMRVLVWEDAMGRSWIGHSDLGALAERHGIKDPATIAAMGRAMDSIVGRAANVYAY
ncbi:serine hydrolase [Roseomonas elaeocarpi]|uniref:Serine hydrolase n=1 Tax=Roseomonas elaeocarpi TaxID=907779 RepID=A0ABV6JN37_9PROT